GVGEKGGKADTGSPGGLCKSCEGSDAQQVAVAGARAAASVLPAKAAARGGAPKLLNPARNFAEGQLEKHFAKHAGEWGAGNITKQGYLKRAQDLLSRQPGGDILGHTRQGGDILRYNARTNEFAVGAADG